MIIFNPHNTPVVYSNDGKILGGGERIEVASLDKHGERALAHGYIIVLDGDDAEEEAATTEEEDASGKEDAAPARASRRTSTKGKAKEEDSGASTGSDGD